MIARFLNLTTKAYIKFLIFCCIFCFSFPLCSKGLCEKAQISVLIGSPNDQNVFTIFGHASLRVTDPELKLDYVFNYGIFDASSTANILNLLKGNLTCELWALNYDDVIRTNQAKGSKLTELVLNLTPEEKNKLWQKLLINAKPENRIYRYDIFKKNCVTLPRSLIEESIDGTINYTFTPRPESITSICEQYFNGYPWSIFFAGLFFGDALGKELAPKEKIFLPDRLLTAFRNATIDSGNRNIRPLVLKENTLVADSFTRPSTSVITPLFCSLLLLAAILVITIIEWRKKKHFRIVDCTLYGIAGLTGIILLLLNTVFAQWYTVFNWFMLWLHPLHLLAVVFYSSKRFNKAAFFYNMFVVISLGFLVLGYPLIPQYFNMAYIPLILCLWIRAFSGILRYKKQS